MCGITGWCDLKKDLTTQLPLLHTMTNTLQKRGPDADGIWCDGPIAFGHQRLAIIDLEGGKQPMTYEKAVIIIPLRIMVNCITQMIYEMN